MPSLHDPVNDQQTSDAEPTLLQATSQQTIKCDVLVVGAGLSGITAIHRFRKLSLHIKCFEAGSELGGVWNYNRYPGARVDSEFPWYQLNIPEVYRDWYFTQRFPDHRELRRYLAHADNVLGLSNDIFFNANVIDASWDDASGLWTVKTAQGHLARTKYLMLATGLLHRKYVPEFPGLHLYKGDIRHSTGWSEDDVSDGKKIAIIGGGSTGVQMVERFGKDASQMTVFLRRPSLCLPMGQRALSREEQVGWKAFYPALFSAGRESHSGFPMMRQTAGALDVPDEERESYYNMLWERGAFNFSLCNYNNIFLDVNANYIAYDFWRRKVCQRLTDPAKQKIMASQTAPYYFGTKRSPLEQDYYDVLNRPNVHIHDLQSAPLETFVEEGIRTVDGVTHEFDAIVLATGFESYTGSLAYMGLTNKDGIDLADIWAGSISTYGGITMHGFPNTFMVYTPHAPTALSNGTTVIEAQVEVIADMISKLEREGAKSIEAELEAQEEWVELLDVMSEITLIPRTDSWWNASNIPGKPGQNLIYVGGIQMYEKQLREMLRTWKGFCVVSGVESKPPV